MILRGLQICHRVGNFTVAHIGAERDGAFLYETPRRSNWDIPGERFRSACGRYWSEIRRLHPGTHIKTTFGVAELVRVRTCDVEVRFPFGTGYLARDALLLPAPRRFTDGVMVNTPFGNGIVRSMRLAEDSKIYEVELVDSTLADGKHPRGFLSATDVRQRFRRTNEETLQLAERARMAGNELYRKKSFDDAITLYKESLQFSLPLSHQSLAAKLRDWCNELRVKTGSNMVQCLLNKTSYASAERLATEVLSWDPSNALGLHNKLFLRRGTARMHTKDYDGAIEDFRRPILANDRLAQKYLQQTRALRKKRQKREQKVWSQAFSLSANEASSESKEESKAGSASPPAPSAAELQSSLGVDSSPTDPAKAPRLEDLLPNKGKKRSQGKVRTAVVRREDKGWWSNPATLGAVGVGVAAIIGAGIWAFSSSRNSRGSVKLPRQ